MDPTREDIPSVESCYLRGRMLLNRSRHADAAGWFSRALQADPHHAGSHAMLALCWLPLAKRTPDAVEAAKRAVALEPEDSHFRGILALALAATGSSGRKPLLSQALKEAREGVRLDPQDSFTHAVEARVYLQLHDFPAAEAAACEALALDTDNAMATEVLSAALLHQHKDEDHSSLVRSQLQRNPEDANSHTSAGWQALLQGRQQDANRHFLEALRLDPMSEAARAGLVEAYRARSGVYRLYVRFGHAMDRFGSGGRRGLLLGGFILYQLLWKRLQSISPGLAAALAIAWVTLALWSHLARGIGGFFMLFDRFARRSLRPREFWEGAVIGGLVTLALLFLGRALWSHSIDDQYAAIALFIGAVPVAAAFSNTHYWGIWLYTAVAALTGLGALYIATSIGLRHPLPNLSEAFVLTATLGVGITWMRLLGIGYH